MPEYILPDIHTLIFILLHRNHPSLPASQVIVMPVFLPTQRDFSRCARFIFRIY